MSGNQSDGIAHIKITDKYDFERMDYDSGIVAIINNFAYYQQIYGSTHEYDIVIMFDYKVE